MDYFFNPRGIAVIGATTNPMKGGYSLLKNLIKGFKGGIYPVNPRYTEIEDIPCYSSVQEVPEPVDLAIVFVPAVMVPRLIEACAERGIKGIMIESGGFAESGEQGITLQEELKQIANQTGVRLWGPNCMGLVDAVRQHVFSFVSQIIWDEGFVPGNVSLIVQSGMLSGVFLIDTMTHEAMDISKVCSIGNKCDVDECDILEYLIQDNDTRAIGLYLESIPDGRRFINLCRSSQKPVVVLKGGKSEKGAKAAMSHTASLAGHGAVISGALRQSGVIEANDFKQLLDICHTLAVLDAGCRMRDENSNIPHPALSIKHQNANSQQPTANSQSLGRIAVLTYSGGAGIVSSDFIDAMGLELAELSVETRDAMKSVFPEWMPVSNPMDLWPAVERSGAGKTYDTALKAACADPHVDAVFVHVFVGGFALNPDMDAMAQTAEAAGKPLFIWLQGKQEDARKFFIQAQKLGIPVFREIQRAAECMTAWFTYKKLAVGSWQLALSQQPTANSQQPTAIEHSALTGFLDEHQSKKILADCGIPVVQEKMVYSDEEAQTIALDFKFPVVMKGLSPGNIHKTEAGLVRLGIVSIEDVKNTFHDLKSVMNGNGDVLIQKQIKGELEIIVGLMRDPQFGPCVMCGLGGIFAEIIGEAVFAVAPLNHLEALNLINSLSPQKLLNGFRGDPPADKDAIAQILVCLGDLGCAYPQIQEIDINPLIICRGKPVAVDASIICD